MNRFPIPAATLALLVGMACAPAPAAGKCDNPSRAVEERACAKAAEGADELRRFVERTRPIHELRFADFARADTSGGSAAARAASTSMAGAAQRSVAALEQ